MGKRLTIGFITAATYLVVFNTVALAAEQNVLVDHQPTRRGGPAADTEFINMFGQPSWQLLADDFTLPFSASVTSISAWGFYDLDNPPASETMRVRFYSSRPGDGLPEDILHEEQLSAFTRVATGQIILVGVDPHEYLYTLNLTTPVDLDGTTRYWLELVQLNDLQTHFRWENSSSDNRSVAFQRPGFPDWTVSNGSDTAFQLHGIPEPASLCFLLFVLGAVTSRRRSGTRMK